MEELFGGGKGGGKNEKQHLLPVKIFVLKILTLMAQVQL